MADDDPLPLLVQQLVESDVHHLLGNWAHVAPASIQPSPPVTVERCIPRKGNAIDGFGPIDASLRVPTSALDIDTRQGLRLVVLSLRALFDDRRARVDVSSIAYKELVRLERLVDEWAVLDRQGLVDVAYSTIDTLWHLHDTEGWFRYPVSEVFALNYAKVVHPSKQMSLSDMYRLLRNGHWTSATDALRDLSTLLTASTTYNGNNSPITDAAKRIKAAGSRLIMRNGRTDVEVVTSIAFFKVPVAPPPPPQRSTAPHTRRHHQPASADSTAAAAPVTVPKGIRLVLTKTTAAEPAPPEPVSGSNGRITRSATKQKDAAVVRPMSPPAPAQQPAKPQPAPRSDPKAAATKPATSQKKPRINKISDLAQVADLEAQMKALGAQFAALMEQQKQKAATVPAGAVRKPVKPAVAQLVDNDEPDAEDDVPLAQSLHSSVAAATKPSDAAALKKALRAAAKLKEVQTSKDRRPAAKPKPKQRPRRTRSSSSDDDDDSTSSTSSSSSSSSSVEVETRKLRNPRPNALSALLAAEKAGHKKSDERRAAGKGVRDTELTVAATAVPTRLNLAEQMLLLEELEKQVAALEVIHTELRGRTVVMEQPHLYEGDPRVKAHVAELMALRNSVVHVMQGKPLP